jgi:Fe-S-cluster containining protein
MTDNEIQGKTGELKAYYDAYEVAVATHKSEAACAKGCAFCCTDAGRIDITTLEGLAIRKVVENLPRTRKKALKKSLASDMKRRLADKRSPCPFLLKNKACEIYPVRPFACRRIYSLHRCNRDNPPVVNQNAMAAAAETIAVLQRLDDTGYSGHLSIILFMLEQPRFLKTYEIGDFRPEEIAAFGRTHRIVINQKVSNPSS